MRDPVPLKFRNPLLITFLFNFNIIKDGYQKLTFTHFPLLISVFYVLYLFSITHQYIDFIYIHCPSAALRSCLRLYHHLNTALPMMITYPVMLSASGI